jgi:hypothetical protein
MSCVAYISVTNSEHSTLLRDEYKICGRANVGSSKSGDTILHREPPYITNRSEARDDFKIKKSVGLPLSSHKIFREYAPLIKNYNLTCSCF